MQERLWAYMAAICRKNKIFVHSICGMADHAHILMRLPPTLQSAGHIVDQGLFVQVDGQKVCMAEGIWVV